MSQTPTPAQLPNPEKVRRQNLWLRDLCNYEDAALSMVREVDLRTCEPELIVCSKGLPQKLFDYWRVVLSSEPQGLTFSGAGRSLALMVRDRVSGGFLGVVGVSDPPTHWTQLFDLTGWRENDAERLASQHRVVMMRRCLPLYEFGQMTGGKLLALLATSREAVGLVELRFSFDVLFFGIRTLHGKGSQYNRLHPRGIRFLGADETDHGFYGMELRENGIAHLRDHRGAAYGEPLTHPLADQAQYWRDRWLTSRMQSTGSDGIIRPDASRYRLTEMMDSKRKTITHTAAGPSEEE